MARPDLHRGPLGTLVSAAALSMLVGGALAVWMMPLDWTADVTAAVERTAALIRSWGRWGIAGSIALMVVHSFLPFPAEIIAVANGMVYGPVRGAAVTWSGAMLGAAAAFGLVRALGRPLAQRLLPARQWQRMSAFSRERGGAALLTARLIPLIAFNLINYAAALTEISWWTFLWATGLGILPLTLLLSILGDGILEMPLWCWLALAVLAGLPWLAPAVRARIAQWCARPDRG